MQLDDRTNLTKMTNENNSGTSGHRIARPIGLFRRSDINEGMSNKVKLSPCGKWAFYDDTFLKVINKQESEIELRALHLADLEKVSTLWNETKKDWNFESFKLVDQKLIPSHD